ncbi:hypothetical protein ACEPAI_4562 [Sanghuangporus weigelae]
MNLVNQEIEERTREIMLGFKRPSLGPGIIDFFDRALQKPLLNYYETVYPEAGVCAQTSRSRGGDHLVTQAEFCSYLIKDGRRITPSKSASKAPNSIIQMEFGGEIFVGQVISIFRHYQPSIGRRIVFLHVCWFHRSRDVNTDIWDEFPELEISFWKYNDSLRPEERGPPSIITSDRIKSQAARATIATRPPRFSDNEEEPESRLLWVTIGLSRESIAI